MHFSKIFLAVLPALAMAQDDARDTTTKTSTTILTKTYTLSEVHTVTATMGNNTATFTPTPSVVSLSAKSTNVASTTAASTAQPSQVKEDNAGIALEASKFAFAGVAGMMVLALL